MFGYCWIKEISKTWLHDFYNSVSPYKTGDLIIFLTFSIFIINPINLGFLVYFVITLLHENTITHSGIPRAQKKVCAWRRVSKRRKNPTLFCVEVATLLWVISSTQLLNVTLEIFFGESAPCLGPGKEKNQIYLPGFMRFKWDNY